MTLGGLTETRGEGQVLFGVRLAPGKKTDLVPQPFLADGGDVGVAEVTQVESTQLGTDRAGQRDDLEGLAGLCRWAVGG